MQNDLIRRKVLLDDIRAMRMDSVSKATAIKTIEWQPAVNEVEKVVHREWIDHGTLSDYPSKGTNNYHLLVCPGCGYCHRTILQDNIGKPLNANYCPNCGAKMDGGKE